jgi:hypothetical protein
MIGDADGLRVKRPRESTHLREPDAAGERKPHRPAAEVLSNVRRQASLGNA